MKSNTHTEETDIRFEEVFGQHLAVDIEGLSKSFGHKRVLDELDFQLPQGYIYAICGNNGAGKSIFLRCITGLVIPNSGKVRVFGEQIGKDTEFPSKVGALIDHPGFLLTENGRRNLELLSMISGKADKAAIRDAMTLVGLDPDEKKPVRTYSVGMRQRLGIAQAIMENPEMIILDEPTAGLDFDAQREIYDFLIQLRQQGKTILFTSHSLPEVKLLCDKAFHLKDGKLTLMQDINSENATR